MITRAAVALFLGLPMAVIGNVILYWMTLFSLTIFFGCFAPAWAIEGLALMEFLAGMLYSVLGLLNYVINPEDE